MVTKLASAICIAVALGLAAPLAAQAASPHAKPSIEGTWAANFVLTMEATPKSPDPLVVPEAQAKAVADAQAKALSDFFAMGLDPEVPMLLTQIDGLPIVRGQRRTRVLVLPADGRMPFTPQARQFWDKLAAPPEKFDNPEDRSHSERCLIGVGQPPISGLAFASPMQILRTPGAVVIHTEYGDEVRVVPITDQHRPKVSWGRLGDSIGRWEGNTLVVETIGQPKADMVRFAPNYTVTDEAIVIERFTAVSDRELNYQFTVIDPKVYTAPWLAEFSWYRTDKLMYEHACHEGNHSLPNILAGARYEEAHPSAKAKTAAGTR